MIFTPDQIEELLGAVRLHHVLFGVEVSGTDVLSSDDLKILKSVGIDPDKILKGMPLAEKSFHFGRLAAALGNYQASKVKYADFIKFVRAGGHRPLSAAELEALNVIKSRSFAAIKNLGRRIESDTTQIVAETEAARRSQYKEILRGVLEEGTVNRKSVQEMVSELGNKTQDWSRNLGRVIDTESHNAYEQGRANEITHIHGDDAEVYKDVYEGACKYCIKLYLTNGIGSAPIIFKLSDLQANGSNYGKPTSEWKATVEGVHPHCRCTMHNYTKGYVWNKDKGIFEAPQGYTKRYNYNVIITVGDNEYHI